MLTHTTVLASLLLLSSTALSQAMLTASPGGLQDTTRISESCPTFSWGQTVGANSYEVTVFATLGDSSNDYQTHVELSQPIILTNIAAPALSWTPSTDQCLDYGGGYVWFVRAINGNGKGDWSEGRRFEVDISSSLLAETVRQEVGFQLSQPDTWRRMVEEALKVERAVILPLTRTRSAAIAEKSNRTEVRNKSIVQGNSGVSKRSAAVRAATFPNPAAFRISNSNGVVFDGPTFGSSIYPTGGTGEIPAEGDGARMMWYPAKAAFRAGGVDGDQWDADSTISGTVTTSAGTTDVSGSGTAFLTELKPGDTIQFTNGSVFAGWGVVDAITTDTALTLVDWGGTVYSGPAILNRTGRFSAAMGWKTRASGNASTAVGFNTVASGSSGAIAAGYNTVASGIQGATAMGLGSRASGAYGATAMGQNTIASGTGGATAMGRGTLASGNTGATALGNMTKATGLNGATALGYATTASGSKGATAMGWGTLAASDSETVVGKFSTAETGRLFTIGNGSSGVDRSNTMVVRVNGDTSMGHSTPLTRLHVVDDINDNGFIPANYVALIDNIATGVTPDVLALRIGTTENPGSGANFVAFFNGSDNLLGEIEGNGSGGVRYKSTGGDYAEYLPQRDRDEMLIAGDIVGVYAGQITHDTRGATRVMVITDRAVVVGNMPTGKAKLMPHQTVTFIGQVPVKVRGVVQAGDVVIASSRNDGTGRAVSVGELGKLEGAQIVGRAWSASGDPGIKKVMVAVGLDNAEMAMVQVKNLRMLYIQQKQEILAYKNRLAELEGLADQVTALQTELAEYRLLATELQQIRNRLLPEPQLVATAP